MDTHRHVAPIIPFIARLASPSLPVKRPAVRHFNGQIGAPDQPGC